MSPSLLLREAVAGVYIFFFKSKLRLLMLNH